jgi:hypothetical protein
LFAIVTTSTPEADKALSAAGVARKWYVFGAGVPRLVIAVSRFTIDRSAEPRYGRTEDNEDRGDFSSAATWSAKCTSPPKATVIGCGSADLVARADVTAPADGVPVGTAVVCDGPEEHPDARKIPDAPTMPIPARPARAIRYPHIL